jgi:hypothetical protein
MLTPKEIQETEHVLGSVDPRARPSALSGKQKPIIRKTNTIFWNRTSEDLDDDSAFFSDGHNYLMIVVGNEEIEKRSLDKIRDKLRPTDNYRILANGRTYSGKPYVAFQIDSLHRGSQEMDLTKLLETPSTKVRRDRNLYLRKNSLLTEKHIWSKVRSL